MIVNKKTRFVKPPKKFNYLSNKTLIPLLAKFKETGKMSDELGSCFLLLANKLATSANFRGYTFIDDCIQDGVECCLKYAHNYDPNKGSNPFGYFTEIMKFAFITRIKAEKHNQNIKLKAMQFDENGYPFMNIIENSLDNSSNLLGNEDTQYPPMVNEESFISSSSQSKNEKENKKYIPFKHEKVNVAIVVKKTKVELLIEEMSCWF